MDVASKSWRQEPETGKNAGAIYFSNGTHTFSLPNGTKGSCIVQPIPAGQNPLTSMPFTMV